MGLELFEIVIAVSEVGGDGDARLEIGGFQRYTALHQTFPLAAVRVRPFFFSTLCCAHYAALFMLLAAVAEGEAHSETAAGPRR